MKVGFLTSYDPGRIKFAKDNGFGSVELLTGYFEEPPAYMPDKPGWEEKALKIKDDFNKAKLAISCIGGFYVNHMEQDKAETCKKVVRNTILLAEKIGTSVAAGFAGRVMSKPLEESLPVFKKIWSEHAKFAEDHGVRIAFEGCPMGEYNTPSGGINCICTPKMYEACFNEVKSDYIGLEWDPSHLIPLGIDPIVNLRQFGSRVYHVHAKGAKVYEPLVAKYGYWYPNAVEHCFPGFGDEDWGLIIKELRRAGYHGDLNIEGWHDIVFRDRSGMKPDDVHVNAKDPIMPDLEDVGLIIAKNHLKQFCPNGF